MQFPQQRNEEHEVVFRQPPVVKPLLGATMGSDSGQRLILCHVLAEFGQRLLVLLPLQRLPFRAGHKFRTTLLLGHQVAAGPHREQIEMLAVHPPQTEHSDAQGKSRPGAHHVEDLAGDHRADTHLAPAARLILRTASPN
jgi:hypothetical protein